MKWPSSTFSFDTLRFRPAWPRAWLLCIAVITLLNWGAHAGLAAKVLYTSVPTGLVQDVYARAQEPASLWLFGNSTLDASIDEAGLERSLGAEVHKFVLGSATFGAMARLARATLERSSAKPAQLVFFVTKDDFNAHGSRASASARYLRAIEDPILSERVLNAIPLYAARYSIRQKLRTALAGAGGSAAARESRPVPTSAAAAPAEGGAMGEGGATEDAFDFKSTYLANLGEHFEFDDDGFAVLAELAHTWQGEIIVVHPPVTQAVWEWQDHFVPAFDSQHVRARLRSRLQEAGGVFLDFSEFYPSSARYFKDAYHLRSSFASEFTARIAPDLKRCLVARQ